MTSAPAIQRRHFLARALALLSGAWLGLRGATRAEADTQSDQPYLAEIRMFAGDFAPHGWAFCDGQLLDVEIHNALFSLIGTTFGGDGQTTFALPDLRGRAPVHAGATVLGQVGGQEVVVLTPAQMPLHSHTLLGSSAPAQTNDPSGRVPARNPLGWPHYSSNIDTSFAADAVTLSGSSTPHDNMMPSLCIHFIICLDGVFPSRP